MIPKIFHVTLPEHAVERKNRLSDAIRRLHPEWDLMIWQDPLISDEFLLGKYFDKCNSGAQLADLVRIDVVFRYGGVYIDADVDLLRNFDPLVERSSFFIGTEDGAFLTNAIFAGEKGHPALEALITELLEHEPDWKIACNLTTGPGLYTRVIGIRKDITVLPRVTFYPFNHDEPASKPHRLSYAVHRWEGSWVKKGHPEQNGKFPFLDLKKGVRKLIKAGFHVVRRVQSVGLEGLKAEGVHGFYPCTPEIMLKTAWGIRMFVNGEDASVTPELLLTGTYEPSEERFVARTLRGGDTFVDVGANVGVFTLLAAQRVGRFGKVIAFEPNENVANLLAKSLVTNWWQERVDLRMCAVGEVNGSGTLRWSRDVLGGARLESGQATSAVLTEIDQLMRASQQLPVRVVRLDDQLAANLEISILKIDVEGHEAAVLRGAAELLSNKAISFILMEAISDIPGEEKWRDTLDEIHKLVRMGYYLNRISPDGTLVSMDIADIGFEHLRTRSVVLSADPITS